MIHTRLIVTPDGNLCSGSTSFRCALGRSGITANKYEGDGATPAGIFPLRACLYRPDRVHMPDTALPVTALTPAMGWCDDPDSADYNRPVTLPYGHSHEILWREDHRYDVIVVTGHNDAPPIPGKGSAIFFHLKEENYKPTAGCIAVSRTDMLALLPALSPETLMEIRLHT